MPDYRIRPATLDDVNTLVHHRIAMFNEMGLAIDAGAGEGRFKSFFAHAEYDGVDFAQGTSESHSR